MLAHKRASARPRPTNARSPEGISTRGGLKSSASIETRSPSGRAEGVRSPTPACPRPDKREEAEPARKKDTKTSSHNGSESKSLCWERRDSGKGEHRKQGDSRPTSPEGPGRTGGFAGEREPRQACRDLPGQELACRARGRDPENVYTVSGVPSINPLPKPQRTFQHHTPTRPQPPPPQGLGGQAEPPPLPSIPLPLPPAPAHLPPARGEQEAWSDRSRDSSNRKSYEFGGDVHSCPQRLQGRLAELRASQLQAAGPSRKTNRDGGVASPPNQPPSHPQQPRRHASASPGTLQRRRRKSQGNGRLFEYFLVVALHKARLVPPYLPGGHTAVPSQGDKTRVYVSWCDRTVLFNGSWRSFKFMRETEDQLKVPQFCFPDAKDWGTCDSFA
ncbi:hypothetical protein AAFF_G00185320, partial [Aldrovandia affinis]